MDFTSILLPLDFCSPFLFLLSLSLFFEPLGLLLLLLFRFRRHLIINETELIRDHLSVLWTGVRNMYAVHVHKLIFDSVTCKTLLRTLRIECHELDVAGAALRRLEMLELLIHPRVA